ncbi:anthocyanidin 3-O-glucosyltransferase 7-like [Euphorbia lathyris]|uniref:anthocyanidin 3-O-glucosyltransferase 7-like n=1 Tax=Euphorbia lathyris TaxID=212925 RepID=UPI00331428EF
MFDLVLNLASATPNLHFSFFNTTKCNKSLLSKKNLHIPPNILFYNLDDGSGSEGSGLFQEMHSLAKAVPENFKRGIDATETQTGRKITCFLTDAMFCYHISSMAEERKVSWIALWVPAPYALPAFLNLDYIQHLYQTSDQPENLILEIIPGLSPINYLDLPVREFIERPPSASVSPTNTLFVSMIRNIHRASYIIMNSFQELNPDTLTEHVKSKFQNVFFLGNLSEVPLSSNDDTTGCLSWLDRQKAESVVYISTGTAIGWPPEQCSALSEALDAFDVPFLWTLKDELKNRLPSGFLDRAKGKVVPWAPQSQVLKHPSIGVYVTHCGYNSVLESVAGRVPMICSSVWTDNHMTAKMIEEVWEIGVRIEGRKITKEGMIKCLETIFKDGKGKKIRENVKNLKQVLLKAAGPDGVAAQDFENLVHKISEE